ncbi:MAG TPA: LysR family transcriptional regulator [Methylomirabilota bacterium]|nr:LysR family transcriptional regulator [Methylomirabilota bacterium]
MRTQDIEVILAIRQNCSFSRAADQLSLSQPAVSLAVKRVEEELGVRIFDRSGPSVSLTREGHQVARGFDRIIEIMKSVKDRCADGDTMRIGLSPLLSGRDVAAMLGTYFETNAVGFAVEFMDSDVIASRSDFDVKVLLPALRRRSDMRVELETKWIGSDNGVFIRSLQEHTVWDRAMHALVDHNVAVTRVIEVNDCGYAYHMASSGAGFTPCVMSGGNGFRDYVLEHLPPLAPVSLDIFAEPEVAELLKYSLGSRGASGPVVGLQAASRLA